MAAYFPMFVNMENKHIMIFGGGEVAARRAGVLLEFGADVRIAAPDISEELAELADKNGNLNLEYRKYQMGEIEALDIVIAATDDEAVNTAIFRECRHKGITVNVASDRQKCDFCFPGIVREGELTVGVAADGKDHRRVAKVTERIRKLLMERL